MLTCFLSNRRALAFYERLGFGRDAVSPLPKALRSGETHVPDYVIMSKAVTRPRGRDAGGGRKRPRQADG